MELPSRLLQKAVLEKDELKRLEQVNKCLKVVSVSLMYRSRHKILLIDENLYFYLLLCLPFNPGNIEQVLNLVICRFQDRCRFFTVFMRNAAKIFEVEEYPYPTQKTGKETSAQLLQRAKALSRKVLFNKKYVEDVYLNLVNIKAVAFEFCQKIWEVSNEKEDMILASREYDYNVIHPFYICRTIMLNTLHGQLIRDAHKFIGSFRTNSLFSINNDQITEVDKLIESKCKGLLRQWKDSSGS
jgi:hypothetical protein